MNAKEILVKAKELISEPSRWTTKLAARDAEGNHVGSQSRFAVCWCSYGAVIHVGGYEPIAMYAIDFLNAVAHRAGFQDAHPILEYNDKLGHAAVMKAFDEAIADADAALR